MERRYYCECAAAQAPRGSKLENTRCTISKNNVSCSADTKMPSPARWRYGALHLMGCGLCAGWVLSLGTLVIAVLLGAFRPARVYIVTAAPGLSRVQSPNRARAPCVTHAGFLSYGLTMSGKTSSPQQHISTREVAVLFAVLGGFVSWILIHLLAGVIVATRGAAEPRGVKAAHVWSHLASLVDCCAGVTRRWLHARARARACVCTRMCRAPLAAWTLQDIDRGHAVDLLCIGCLATRRVPGACAGGASTTPPPPRIKLAAHDYSVGTWPR